MPVERRRTAFVFLKHWSEEKYLCLDWEKFNWHSGIIGGLEGDEDAIEAAKREILEETGYKNARFVEYVSKNVHSSFYAGHKQVNRYAEGVGMLFQLENDEWEEPSEEETKNHKAVWIETDKMDAFLNLPNFQYMWGILKSGEEECFTQDGILINSGEFTGLTSQEAREKMTAWLEGCNLGAKKVNYRLRDWLVSRQRYWGAPIPIVYCEQCGVKEEKTKLSLSFHHQEIFDRLLSGEKTVETRALNPEEKDRYFGDVLEGDRMTFVSKQTGEERIFLVKKAYHFKNLRELFERKDVQKKISSEVYETFDEFEASYAALASGYAEKSNQNGLVGWEVELMTVEKMYPLEEKDLPVKLPTDVDFRPTGESPLTRSESFHDVKCPQCGEKARRESDTMDTFVCSSWYYLRFADPQNADMFAAPEKLAKWLPVDVYMGGAEHTVLHLLYARFFTKALKKYGHVNFDEPFLKLKHQGMVLAEDGRKMSKSLGNVVNPDQVVAQFGADTLRLYEMFMGPLEDAKAWKTDNLVGPRRFLEKIWRMQDKVADQDNKDIKLRSLLHKTIKKVTEDIEGFHFNTAISNLMILTNEMDRQETIARKDYEALVLMLAPLAPHIAEELWESLGHAESLSHASWPDYEEQYLQSETVDMMIQVNGKLRSKLTASLDDDQKSIEERVLQDEKVKEYMQGKNVKKIIFVPKRLVNVVVE
jgi:leucyl-tRNA synthetase